MLRWLATLGIVALLALTAYLPWHSIGRRGVEPASRLDVMPAVVVGGALPALQLQTLEGANLSLEDFLGHRVLLTFERSVDW